MIMSLFFSIICFRGQRYALFSVPPNVWRIFSSFSACKYFKERRGETRATSWLDCYAEPRMLLQRKLKSDWSPPAPRWGVSLRRREAQCGAVLDEVRPYSGGGLRNISISISLPHSRRVPSSLGKRAWGQPFIVIWPSGEYVAGYVEMVWSVVSPG